MAFRMRISNSSHPSGSVPKKTSAGMPPTPQRPAVSCAIRNRIRELRAATGDMTQQALAAHIGVTRQTVNAIEQGKYSPSLELAFQIARVFSVALDDVFQYPEES